MFSQVSLPFGLVQRLTLALTLVTLSLSPAWLTGCSRKPESSSTPRVTADAKPDSDSTAPSSPAINPRISILRNAGRCYDEAPGENPGSTSGDSSRVNSSGTRANLPEPLVTTDSRPQRSVPEVLGPEAARPLSPDVTSNQEFIDVRVFERTGPPRSLPHGFSGAIRGH
ncbi:MAG: hypothetical protein R3C01_08280 [Planctomycetaceae bacterium]